MLFLIKILKTVRIMLYFLPVSFNNLAEFLDPLRIKMDGGANPTLYDCISSLEGVILRL
jgi:hypothetical protein